MIQLDTVMMALMNQVLNSLINSNLMNTNSYHDYHLAELYDINTQNTNDNINHG